MTKLAADMPMDWISKEKSRPSSGRRGVGRAGTRSRTRFEQGRFDNKPLQWGRLICEENKTHIMSILIYSASRQIRLQQLPKEKKKRKKKDRFEQ